MAGIGKNTGKPDSANDSLDELKRKYNESITRIRTLLNGKKDTREVADETKRELRTEYSRAAQYAKSLADRSTDQEQSEEYRKSFEKLTSRAAQYGSVMKSKVPDTTLDDIAGLDNVKSLVQSFIFMAANDKLLKQYKIEGGLGLLMYGAPGTGKTMFAEAIANAMKLPLFVVTPADIFKSYVGESEAAVKQIFQEIEACPDGAILFVDECESIFSIRTNDTKDYKAAVTTELLQRINGFGVDGSKRILVGATNRPDIIDPAYLRYKRFSYRVHIPPPDVEAKRAIIHGKLREANEPKWDPKVRGKEDDRVLIADDVTVEDIVAMTERKAKITTAIGTAVRPVGYYSAADICGIVEEACRMALEKVRESGKTDYIPPSREMFEDAFSRLHPSITEEQRQFYENFK